MDGIEARVAGVIAGVVAQALRDSGAGGLVLLAAGSPEGVLLTHWLSDRLGAGAVEPAPAAVEIDGSETRGPERDDIATAEAERQRARVFAATHGRLLAHPAHKTELLLGRALPPEPVLPLGDLYASEVAHFAGHVTLTPELGTFAERAGGIEALDAVLRQWIDGREKLDRALHGLDVALAADLDQRFARGRFWRQRAGLVPKLGSRTIGIDLLF